VYGVIISDGVNNSKEGKSLYFGKGFLGYFGYSIAFLSASIQ
jgi:hypothetical protein